MAILEVGNFGHRIVGSVVEHRDRNHGGQSASDAAGEEKIKAHLRLASRTAIRWLMPGIDGRAIGSRLLLIGRVAQGVVELRRRRSWFQGRVRGWSSRRSCGIGGAVRIAGVGRLGHPDANETHRLTGTATRRIVSVWPLPAADGTLRKCLPDAACGRFDGIVAGPILDDVVRGIGLAPRDANAVNGLRLRQIEHDPLRMQGRRFRR